MKGEIKVTSELNKGTTFTLLLPVLQNNNNNKSSSSYQNLIVKINLFIISC